MVNRILVIDDEKGVRDAFVMALEDEDDYEVDTAESGEKGLEKFNSDKYHLVYLDLKMAKMTGAEVLRVIRSKDKDVIVYIITAFAKEYFDELQSVKDDGIDFNLLKKPFDSEQIVAVTKGMLE